MNEMATQQQTIKGFHNGTRLPEGKKLNYDLGTQNAQSLFKNIVVMDATADPSSTSVSASLMLPAGGCAGCAAAAGGCVGAVAAAAGGCVGVGAVAWELELAANAVS